MCPFECVLKENVEIGISSRQHFVTVWFFMHFQDLFLIYSHYLDKKDKKSKDVSLSFTEVQKLMTDQAGSRKIATQWFSANFPCLIKE